MGVQETPNTQRVFDLARSVLKSVEEEKEREKEKEKGKGKGKRKRGKGRGLRSQKVK